MTFVINLSMSQLNSVPSEVVHSQHRESHYDPPFLPSTLSKVPADRGGEGEGRDLDVGVESLRERTTIRAARQPKIHRVNKSHSSQ